VFNYLELSVVVNTKHLKCSLKQEHFGIITLWYVINVDHYVFGPAMFLLYHSEGCNICGGLFRKCYINDLHTTTCSGMLGHRIFVGYPKVTVGYSSRTPKIKVFVAKNVNFLENFFS
jgi:hypothetical protein